MKYGSVVIMCTLSSHCASDQTLLVNKMIFCSLKRIRDIEAYNELNNMIYKAFGSACSSRRTNILRWMIIVSCDDDHVSSDCIVGCSNYIM